MMNPNTIKTDICGSAPKHSEHCSKQKSILLIRY